MLQGLQVLLGLEALVLDLSLDPPDPRFLDFPVSMSSSSIFVGYFLSIDLIISSSLSLEVEGLGSRVLKDLERRGEDFSPGFVK